MRISSIRILFGALFASLVLTTARSLQAYGYDEQGCLNIDVTFQYGHGCWVYYDTGANKDKPVRVWYYYPVNFSRGSRKVIFAMHGSSRDAVNTLSRWKSYADTFGALVIAPEFSREYYPKGRNYNRGNVRDATGNLRNIADWTFTTIEEIFDEVVESIPDAPKRYSLQGHSAGGQFVHRMALLAANYRIETAVAANPGWYLMPDENYLYPCGISSLPPDKIDLAAAYAANLVITLGTKDNDPNAAMLDHGFCAELQGTNRYDRGIFFYGLARQDAMNRNMSFDWKLVEVQDVAHDSSAMVKPAAAEIFTGFVRDEPLRLVPTQDATVKEDYPNSNYGLSSTLQVDGKSKKTVYMQFDLESVNMVDAAMLRIEVTDRSKGVQSIYEAKHNNWSETGLTYRNQPGIANLVTTLDGAHDGALSIDITDFVRSNTGKIVTLVLSSSDADGLYLRSGESASPPVLEVH